MSTALARCLITLFALAIALPVFADDPWPAVLEDHVPVKPGEHPRLLFRESDLPALREKARTDEGQAMLKRLRELLNGSDGKTMPGKMGAGPGDSDGFAHAGAGSTFTISHVAGYGLLYQLTGDKLYADLGRKSMDAALAGHRGADKRYSFRNPSGALRAGPSLGWYAVGYDLCYDGWDEDYRQKIGQIIANYNEGKNMSLAELVRGSRHHPRSNHWGMQVGGGAMATLATMGDPGVERDDYDKLLAESIKAMKRNLTEGFGDGGYFAEGDGTGSMSSHIIFLAALQAWKNAAGKDFITPRPNAQWTSLRWMLGTVVRGDKLIFHSRDGYPHNVWDRDGFSGAGYFGYGFGASANIAQEAAWLWFHNEFFKQRDLKRGTPYGTASYLPHIAVVSFVNWPLDVSPLNPARCIPRASVDHQYNYCMFRNRWQDGDDIVVTFLATRPRKHTKRHEIGPIWITAFGKTDKWGAMDGPVTDFAVMDDGCAFATTKDGTSLAVDFSGASGAEGVLILTGPGAPDDGAVNVGDRKFAVKILSSGKAPDVKVDGGKLIIGKQAVHYADGRLHLEVRGEPWDGPSAETLKAASQ